MKTMRECTWGRKILMRAGFLVLVLALGLLLEQFSIVSNAQSQGKVTASSANIRKSADADSDVIASATKDASVTINKQVTAADNTVWYQVFVDANTLGYIRSDLVSVTDGTTPPKGTDDSNAGNTETPSNPAPETPAPVVNETPAEVTAMEPMSANVTGAQSVRVRSNASTNSSIVAQAQNEMVLTVTGQATGKDGKLWYQVNFISDGKEVTGFIRSDYVKLSGELIPEGTTPEHEPEETPQEPEVSVQPEVTKDWDTQYDADIWYLVNNVEENRYKITDIFGTLKDLQAQYDSAASKTKSQTIAIVILVILLVVMSGAVAYLVFKIKDMTDSAYFSEVEKETLRRRTADRPTADRAAAGGQRVMQTVGSDRRQGGARPTGTRAAGGRPEGVRPAGGRPEGARPTGGRPEGARPAGRRPEGTRPAGTPVQTQGGARPTGARPTGTRPTGAPTQNVEGQVRRSVSAPRDSQEDSAQNAGWKSKNFMTDDDEFEFEFLNWDGDDNQ